MKRFVPCRCQAVSYTHLDVYKRQVLTADIPGEILAVATPAGGCRHTTGRSFCVDVDALGTTLVAVGIAATTIVHVAWPEPCLLYTSRCV